MAIPEASDLFWSTAHWQHPLQCEKEPEKHSLSLKTKDIAITILLGILTAGVGGVVYFFWAAAERKVKHIKKEHGIAQRTEQVAQQQIPQPVETLPPPPITENKEEPPSFFPIYPFTSKEDWLKRPLDASSRTYVIDDWEKPGIYVLGYSLTSPRQEDSEELTRERLSPHGWDENYCSLSLSDTSGYFTPRQETLSTHAEVYQAFTTLLLMIDVHMKEENIEKRKNIVINILTNKTFDFQNDFPFQKTSEYKDRDKFYEYTRDQLLKIFRKEKDPNTQILTIHRKYDPLHQQSSFKIPLNDLNEIALKITLHEKFYSGMCNDPSAWRQVLLGTGDQVLIHGLFSSTEHSIFAGMVFEKNEEGKWTLKGENRLGIALMELRETLRMEGGYTKRDK